MANKGSMIGQYAVLRSGPQRKNQTEEKAKVVGGPN